MLPLADARRAIGRNIMKTHYTVALSMVAGAALGATAIQGLHAQVKPPIYYVAEIDVTNPDAYAKEYAPKAQAIIKAAGGRILAVGGTAGGAKANGRVAGAPHRAGVLAWVSSGEIYARRSHPSY